MGAAWYQKDIYISEEYENKSIILFLERCHWETKVWVDGEEIGYQDSLCTAHQYDITKYTTVGNHIITIRVDNNMKYNVGENAHSVTKETQTNWNGIVGDIQLRVYDKLRITDLQIYPDIFNKSVRLSLEVENKFTEAVEGKIILKANSFNTSVNQEFKEKVIVFNIAKSTKTFVIDYEMGDDIMLWDEFSPVLYKLKATLQVKSEQCDFYSEEIADFGMRSFKNEGTQFSINGRRTFLRGTLECCVFPLTGYPPTDIESWLNVFEIAKAYGLNHFRFHSWCPPESAFRAADQTGFMLQIETPVWTVLGDDIAVDSYIYNEGDRILRDYGNHPSFCMLCVGNEPSGENQIKFLSDIVAYWKGKDSRRLYTGCSGWPEIEENQYHSLQRRGGALRCQDWEAELSDRLNADALITDFDFGMLNVFWQNKGYVDKKVFKSFCREVVPLLRMKKVVWTNDEIFRASVQIANFGEKPLANSIITYSIVFKNGINILSCEFVPINIPIGNDKSEHSFDFNLTSIKEASELVITLGIKNTDYTNSWSIWVYPTEKEVKLPESIIIVDTLEEALKGVEGNKKVLFLPKSESIIDNEVGLGFTTIFWNTEWTNGQKPHTLGILCNPEKKVFSDFVTDNHSNWQWFDLIKNSKPMIMDEFALEFQPLIQVIDDWNKNRKIGLLFEAKIGKGKLILSSIDLKNNLPERPVARQLLKSLLQYMSCEQFAPEQQIGIKQLTSIIN